MKIRLIRLIRQINPISLIEVLLYRLIPPFRRLHPIFQRLIAITLTLSLTLSMFGSYLYLFPQQASAAWPPALEGLWPGGFDRRIV